MARFQHKLAALHHAFVALRRSNTEGSELVAEAGELGETLRHMPGIFGHFLNKHFSSLRQDILCEAFLSLSQGLGERKTDAI